MNDREYIQRVHAMEQRLYRIAQAMLWRSADCADAVQEAVFRGWLRKEKMHTQYFETWLIRILINICKDQLRRRGRERTAILIEITTEDRMCEDLQLRLALRQLPEKYRLPLVLHYLEGYSVKETADMLGDDKRINMNLYAGRALQRSPLVFVQNSGKMHKNQC